MAAYVGGAFWFTPTDFANPAVTLARALTDTFAGIRPSDVPGFIVAEIAGGKCCRRHVSMAASARTRDGEMIR